LSYSSCPSSGPAVFLHTFSPYLPDLAGVTIALGIIGATVMPHALFLRLGLTQRRVVPKPGSERTKLRAYSNIEDVVALTVAALGNMAMVIMASGAPNQGRRDVAEIEVHTTP